MSWGRGVCVDHKEHNGVTVDDELLFASNWVLPDKSSDYSQLAKSWVRLMSGIRCPKIFWNLVSHVQYRTQRGTSKHRALNRTGTLCVRFDTKKNLGGQKQHQKHTISPLFLGVLRAPAVHGVSSTTRSVLPLSIADIFSVFRAV